ncbi:MAG: hypothetical protein QY317_16180 [Candidatus Jettenia caeni]|nr:MAG: hypothetical protein QY317_16180 [Candidatus Jettenia caeni]
MAFGDADIQYLLQDMGVNVTHGVTTVKGLVDFADELLLQAGQSAGVGKVIAVTIKTDSLPNLKIGDSVTVGGVSYTVRERLQIDDGALTKFLCKGV